MCLTQSVCDALTNCVNVIVYVIGNVIYYHKNNINFIQCLHVVCNLKFYFLFLLPCMCSVLYPERCTLCWGVGVFLGNVLTYALHVT